MKTTTKPAWIGVGVVAIITTILALGFTHYAWAETTSWVLCLAAGAFAIYTAIRTKSLALGIVGVVLLVFPWLIYAVILGLYWAWQFLFNPYEGD